MSGPMHTLGPWEQGSEIGALRTEILARPEHGPAVVICTVATRKEVGALSDEKRVVDCPEGIANLRLIGAAPDLLEALEYIVSWGAEWDGKKARDMARAAIAKATGGDA